MPGLSNSRWASSSIPPLTSWPRPAPSPCPGSVPRTSHKTTSGAGPPSRLRNAHSFGSSERPSPQQELSRFLKIVARLNWKLPYLNLGYENATARDNRSDQDNEATEIHFKLDFHEFYMLLERALVHLMGVYGIVIHRHHVSRHAPSDGSSSRESGDNAGQSTAERPTAEGGTNSGLMIRDPITGSVNPVSAQQQRQPQPQQHRYHANVLAALDNPDNPLNPYLGQGDVRRQLSRAKELRNRWKNADDGGGTSGTVMTSATSDSVAPLESYNLEQMLQTIFAAFDRAFVVTEAYVKEIITTANNDNYVALMDQSRSADWSTNGDDWEFMLDAMDWEAV